MARLKSCYPIGTGERVGRGTAGLRYRRAMPGFDLHTHSTFSDGTLDPEQVVELAATRGLTGIALTDHDNTGGVERARAAAKRTGLTVLLGCELSAEHDANPVHVLAYGFDPGEPVFAAKRAWILEGRVGRTRRMVERLRELGAPVDFDRVRELAGGGALGRPHVARAMVEAGVVDELGDAFSQDWIGTGGRAYVAKDAVTPTEAVELIHGAGGVAVLAHPSVHAGAAPVPEPVIRAMAAAGLDGLEVDHPDQPPGDRARWRALAAELGLETTGASDCHGALYGYRLGSERTPDAAVDRLLARA